MIMDRIDAILKNSEFKKHMEYISTAEKTRRFCLHGLQHSIDVARVAYIINLEDNLMYDKDVIYGMALLHDIGRSREYEKGIGHHEAGAEIASRVLKQSGFNETECEIIADAIACHKNPTGKERDLRYILYRADKLTRNCFYCQSSELCYWSEEMKNKTLIY